MMRRKMLEKRISALEQQVKDGNMAIAQMVDVWLMALKRFSEHYHFEVPELDELIEKSRNKLGND